jgi:hypothetical protein
MRKLTLFAVAAAGLAIAATSAEARMGSGLAVPEATAQPAQYYYGGGYYRPRYYAPRYYAPRYYYPRYRYYY